MKITYKFNEQELYNFNMFRATRKNSATIPTAIMISCAYLAAMLIIAYMCKFQWYLYLASFGAAALVFAFIMWFLHHKMKRSIKLLMFRQRKEDIMPQTTITLFDDYFEVYTVNRTSEINYESLERVEKSKEFIYLQLDQHGEVGIPIRAFDSDVQMNDFLTQLIDNTPKATHVGLTYLTNPEKAKK